MDQFNYEYWIPTKHEYKTAENLIEGDCIRHDNKYYHINAISFRNHEVIISTDESKIYSSNDSLFEVV